MNWLGRCARVVDHLAIKNVAQGAPLGGGSTLQPMDRNHEGQCTALFNTLRTGSFKLFKHPLLGFLTILTL